MKIIHITPNGDPNIPTIQITCPRCKYRHVLINPNGDDMQILSLRCFCGILITYFNNIEKWFEVLPNGEQISEAD